MHSSESSKLAKWHFHLVPKRWPQTDEAREDPDGSEMGGAREDVWIDHSFPRK